MIWTAKKTTRYVLENNKCHCCGHDRVHHHPVEIKVHPKQLRMLYPERCVACLSLRFPGQMTWEWYIPHTLRYPHFLSINDKAIRIVITAIYTSIEEI